MVYTLTDGIFYAFGSDNTYAFRNFSGVEVLEYQYTHVERNNAIVGRVGEFVAAGTRIGPYGIYGRTDANYSHVHVVVKHLRYDIAYGQNVAAVFGATNDPYTAPDIGISAPFYILLGEVRDIPIIVNDYVVIHIFPRGLTTYVVDTEFPSELILSEQTGIIEGNVTESARTGSPQGTHVYTITITGTYLDRTTISDAVNLIVLAPEG